MPTTVKLMYSLTFGLLFSLQNQTTFKKLRFLYEILVWKTSIDNTVCKAAGSQTNQQTEEGGLDDNENKQSCIWSGFWELTRCL